LPALPSLQEFRAHPPQLIEVNIPKAKQRSTHNVKKQAESKATKQPEIWF